MSKLIYLVQPTSFDVAYVINPWMAGNINLVDRPLAMQQWNNLCATLNVLGVHTVVLPPAPVDCPDAVFVANAGLIINNNFFSACFKHADRMPEEEYFAEYFKSVHYDVQCLEKSIAFEGAGDALFSGDGFFLFLGNGSRTDKNVVEYISKLSVDFETVQLDLIDPDFYHLDTCFCPLDTGELLWHPAAFSKESVAKIQAIYPHDQRMVVSLADANSFGCNAVSVGTDIILPLVSDELQSMLRSKGYNPVCVDMSEFLLAGGGPKCCTLHHVTIFNTN